jgi:hypothetical protein
MYRCAPRALWHTLYNDVIIIIGFDKHRSCPVYYDVDTACDHGVTPLHLAAMYGHGDIVSALLSRGADPTADTTLRLEGVRILSLRGYFSLPRFRKPKCLLGTGVYASRIATARTVCNVAQRRTSASRPTWRGVSADQRPSPRTLLARPMRGELGVGPVFSRGGCTLLG